jgi:acetate kinase
MATEGMHVLTVNAGSSSIKFDLWARTGTLRRVFGVSIEKIGQAQAVLAVKPETGADSPPQAVDAPDHVAATRLLVDWLQPNLPAGGVAAIGHRIVHGGPEFWQPRVIDQAVLRTLGELEVFDPEHLPVERQLIGTLQQLLPGAPQVACFDTAFHHDLPPEARLPAIPRRFIEQGVRRYGFHGLSYSFLMQELARLVGEPAAQSRVILAHLGNGVSLAAVRGGKPIDTTMGLTPAGGVPMSTRSGDLDPGLLSYLARTENLDAAGFDRLTGFESGLLGLSGSSSDMETLLAHESSDERAAEAIAVFCYQVKKTIGGLAAALGGLDQLVFTGGMGENAPAIRARICDGLGFLGISLDSGRNADNAGLLSAEDSRVAVHLVHSDEALIIAQNVIETLKLTGEEATSAE